MKRLPLSLEAESVASVALDDWRDHDGSHTCHPDCPCHVFYAAHQRIIKGDGIIRCSCGAEKRVPDNGVLVGWHKEHVRAERSKQPRW